MTENIKLEDILSVTLGNLVNIMYLNLKENDAKPNDNTSLKFGNRNFEAVLTVKIKKSD